jgi:hypothetical protein
MEQNSESLEEIVLNDLPIRFASQLIQKLPHVYPEAKSRAYDDPALEEIQAKHMLPQHRYSLAQALFQREAAQAGLEVTIEEVPANGYKYPLVVCGRLRLTIHHAHFPDEFVDICGYRKQHSAVNDRLLNPLLPFFASFDPVKLSEATEVYANVLHGANPVTGKVDELGFLRIAFPSAKKKEWAGNLNLFDLHRKMLERQEREMQKAITVDLAIPRLKKKTN